LKQFGAGYDSGAKDLALLSKHKSNDYCARDATLHRKVLPGGIDLLDQELFRDTCRNAGVLTFVFNFLAERTCRFFGLGGGYLRLRKQTGRKNR
jgi:hypothetical protein